MDNNKRKALIQWVNILTPGPPVNSILDLDDGIAFVQLLKLSDEGLIPEDPKTKPDRLDFVKQYLEGFYSMTLCPGSTLLNFDIVSQEIVNRKDKEWELGKILLALLVACILEKKNDVFVAKATALSESVQMEIMQMLQPMIVNSQDIGNHLSEDFSDILKKTTDMNAHQDAALFFQLVNQGNNMSNRVTSTPTVDLSFNLSRLSNHGIGSPVSHHHGLDMSLGASEIASPLRMMTLTNSPGTPLAALMQSPQLAQKALIRQKEREIKKLELSLQNERHLRNELELDIHDKTKLLNEKEQKIKEFENHLKEQRKIKDIMDEIDTLKMEKEKNEKDLNRLHQKLTDLQNIKDQCVILEQENRQLSSVISDMRTELQTMESLKKSHEDYRTQSHFQSVRVAELESLVQHKTAQLEQKHNDYLNSEEKAKNLSCQIVSLKNDMEEMEEMMTCRGSVVGESMGVISDKRIKELEEEMDHIKSTYVELTKYEQLQQKYGIVVEARDTFESKFTDMNKQCLEKEAKVDELQIDISRLNTAINEIEESKSQLNQKVKDMDKVIDQLKQSEAKLLTSEKSALEAQKVAEDQVLSFQRDVGRLQTELKLVTQELESTKMASENRRQTLAASIDVAVSERKTIEQRMMKANQMLEEKVEELKTDLQNEQDQHNEEIANLKSKIQHLQSCLKQSEILLDNEKWTKDSVITALKDELKKTGEEFSESEQRLQEKISALNEVKGDLEGQIMEQKRTYKQKIEQLNVEISSLKTSSRQKENDLCDKIQIINDENVTLKNELENLRTSNETLVTTWEQKYSKCESKSQDQEEALRKELKALQDKYQWSVHDQQSLSDEISDLKSSVKDRDADIENLQSNLSNQKQYEMELKGQLSQVQNSKDNLNHQLEVLKQQLVSEQESHSALISKISQENEIEVQQLKEVLSTKEASSLNTKQNLEACINEFQTKLEKEIEKGKEKERAASFQVEQLREQLSETEEQYKEELSVNSEKTAALNNELEQLRMSSAVTEETLNKELYKLQSELSKISAEYGELNSRYVSVTEQERSRDDRINELHKQIDNLETQKRSSESSFEEMKEKINDLSGQTALIKKVAESKQADNDKLNSENKNLIDKVEDLNEKLLKECKENDEMRHKRKEMNGVINNLEQRLSEKNLEVEHQKSELEKCLESLQQKSETLFSQESALSELKTELQTQQEEVSKQTKQIDGLNEERTQLCAKVEALSSELQQKEEKYLENLNSLKESHLQHFSELQKSSKEKEDQLIQCVDKLKLDIMDCDGEIKRLETENKDLKCTCGELKEKINENDSIHRAEKDSLAQKFKKEKSELSDIITKTKKEKVTLESKLSCAQTEYEASSRTLNEQADIIRSDFQRRVQMLEEEIKQERESAVELKKQCEMKVSETEKYWQSQLEELESEYSQASVEQKQEYVSQIQEQENRFQSKFEVLMQEREMILANQKMTFQERVNHLENRLTQKQKEIQKLNEETKEEKERTETDYKQKLSNIESLLKKEMADQKELMNELKQNKERVNELQSALREKRTNYESSLATKTQSWESEMENIREEYTNKMAELEREKNRQIEEEKQRRMNSEELNNGVKERMEVSLAENNSLKQQLAAVEEEKNQLILEYERTLDHKNIHAQDREKLKMTVEKLKGQAQKLEVERNFLKDQLEKRVQELKEELVYNERKWEEENEGYKKQYREENQQKIHLQQQMKNIQEDSENKDKIINQYKKHYAQKKEINQSLQQEVSVHTKMAEKYKDKADKLEIELNSMKNSNKTKFESSQNEIQVLRKDLEEQKQKFNKAETEVAPIKAQLQEELNKNKSLQSKVNTMEVQLDYADKQLRELRHKLDNAGTVFLGDNTEFLKLKKESDVSLMEEDGLMTSYNLRSSRKNSLEGGASQCSTENQYNFKSDEDEKSISPMTLRSHRRTSYSDTNLNATIASTDSVRSTTSKGMKRFVNEEDAEADVLEWTRLGELSRRNTLCLPHLKTSYPVETQKIQLSMFPDKSLQNSSIKPNGLKKRKQELGQEEDMKTDYDSSRQKQAKHGTVYQKPGPPTPGNAARRNSRGTPGRSLHSPRSPLTSLSRRRTPKRTPKKTPKKLDSENIKPSTTFSIGFTPKNKRLTRQQGFVSASKSSSKGHQPRQPLAVKNCFQQTGV